MTSTLSSALLPARRPTNYMHLTPPSASDIAPPEFVRLATLKIAVIRLAYPNSPDAAGLEKWLLHHYEIPLSLLLWPKRT